MSRLVTYTRQRTPDVPGCQELDYWRRVHLPYNQLVQQHVFEQFSQVELGTDQYLAPSMLRSSEITLLHNWVPRGNEEVEVFIEAYQMEGHLPAFWIYDLSDPTLLEIEEVRAILSLMNLVTVPNDHMLTEVRYYLRRGQAASLVLPSAISQTWLLKQMPPRVREINPAMVRIGMLGDHDWERFLPGFFEVLATAHGPIANFQIITDQAWAFRMAQEWAVPVQPVQLLSHSYSGILSSLDVALVPRDGKDGRHVAWASEYGLAMCPVLACRHSSYDDPLVATAALLEYREPASFVEAIVSWLSSDQGMEQYLSAARMGYAMAMRSRVSVAAMTYRLRLRSCLPNFCFLS